MTDFDKKNSHYANLSKLGFSKYMISDRGEVFSNVYSSKSNKLKPFVDRGGYENYSLWGDDGKRKTMRVHRLVALMFIPNPHNLPQVNHKDGNTRNNHVDNLEWMSNLDNAHHASENFRDPQHLEPYQVHHICRLLEAGYPEIEAAKEAKVKQRRVADILYGRTHTGISHKYTFPKGDLSNFNKPVAYPQVQRYIEPALPKNAEGLVHPLGRPCKLPVSLVREICEYLESHWSDMDIAKELNVSPNAVARIRAREQYDEITQEYSF